MIRKFLFLLFSLALIGTFIVLVCVVFLSNNFSLKKKIEMKPQAFQESGLTQAFFLYQKKGENTIYRAEGDSFRTIDIGTKLHTTYLSRRGDHFASIQYGRDTGYEVRLDTERRYSSLSQKWSASASPTGDRIAYAETDEDLLKEVLDNKKTTFPSKVYVLEENSEEPRFIGEGFAPFFLNDNELAWFAPEGLMKIDLSSGNLTLVSGDIKPFAPPYPAPAISRDGQVIAWTMPETGIARAVVVLSDGVRELASYSDVREPIGAVDSNGLYILERASGEGVVSRRMFNGDTERKKIQGLPQDILIQIAL